jgi:hypothetical protein
VPAPETIKAGGPAEIAITITDAKQGTVKALVPVQVEVRDANGKPAEGNGYYGAKDGTLSVKLDIAGNDDPACGRCACANSRRAWRRCGMCEW